MKQTSYLLLLLLPGLAACGGGGGGGDVGVSTAAVTAPAIEVAAQENYVDSTGAVDVSKVNAAINSYQATAAAKEGS